ncbi:hypothetical protein [Sphingomonas zeae]|jgi:hypothetical protein
MLRKSWKCGPLRSAFTTVSRQRWSKLTDPHGFPLRVAAVRGWALNRVFSERVIGMSMKRFRLA